MYLLNTHKSKIIQWPVEMIYDSTLTEMGIPDTLAQAAVALDLVKRW